MSDYTAGEKNIIVQMMKGLTDRQLQQVYSAVIAEREIRAQQKHEKGHCAPLNEHERALVKERKTIEAIKAYRDRTGSNLFEARFVVDEYRDELFSRRKA